MVPDIVLTFYYFEVFCKKEEISCIHEYTTSGKLTLLYEVLCHMITKGTMVKWVDVYWVTTNNLKK